MVRPERFELPTNRFEADYSIQLSYGRLIDDVGYYFLPRHRDLYRPGDFFAELSHGQKKGPTFYSKPLIYLAPPDGLEPPT